MTRPRDLVFLPDVDNTLHDGAPSTNGDVAFSNDVNRLQMATSGIGSAAPYIESIDTPDAHTAVINWKITYYHARGIIRRPGDLRW